MPRGKRFISESADATKTLLVAEMEEKANSGTPNVVLVKSAQPEAEQKTETQGQKLEGKNMEMLSLASLQSDDKPGQIHDELKHMQLSSEKMVSHSRPWNFESIVLVGALFVIISMGFMALFGAHHQKQQHEDTDIASLLVNPPAPVEAPHAAANANTAGTSTSVASNSPSQVQSLTSTDTAAVAAINAAQEKRENRQKLLYILNKD